MNKDVERKKMLLDRSSASGGWQTKTQFQMRKARKFTKQPSAFIRMFVMHVRGT